MKLALVTGGCRRLGAAIAGHLARHGYALALHASSDATPEDELRAVLQSQDIEWRGFAADLSDGAATEELVPQVTESFGRAPDLLVNSAAAFGQDRPRDTSFDDLLSHYAVNCAAPVVLARSYAEAIGGRAGAIVNILDQRIAHPHGDQFAYTLSKLALSEATDILARELAPAVRLNAVAPGLTIVTDEYSDAQTERVRGAMPLERLPEPAQVADAVLWLAEAQAVTGQTIFVDGGAHLKRFERDFLHI